MFFSIHQEHILMRIVFNLQERTDQVRGFLREFYSRIPAQDVIFFTIHNQFKASGSQR